MSKLENRAQDPITREQFEEILQIMEEVEGRKGKKITGQDIGKATYMADTAECDKAEHVVQALLEKEKQETDIEE